MFLLDVDVLIALIDPLHSDHKSAWRWFERSGLSRGWATCAITELGALRVLSARNYLHRVELTEAANAVETLRAVGWHEFWVDEISPCDPRRFHHELFGSKQSTDVYLLALAVHRSASLATFDRGIDSAAIPGGGAALHLIDT